MIREDRLKKEIAEAFKILFSSEIDVTQLKLQPTRKEFEGSHTLVVFPYLKITRKSPEDSANMIGQYLQEHSKEVESYNVIKGFLNLSLHFSSWIDAFQEMVLNTRFGQLPVNGQKVVVEYSSPNTNKPLHLGHLRNNFLGFSVSEILKACGYEVVKLNLVNDRGIHICKSMLAYQKFGQGETPESSGLKGDHLIGKYYVKFDQVYKEQIQKLKDQGKTEEEAKTEAPFLLEAQEMLRKWEINDPEVVSLWQKMNGWVYQGFNETYKKIGVDFDKYYYESKTYLLGKEIVEEGLEKGIFIRKENGSVWADLTGEGLDEKLLLRSDGTSVYMTQDLGTAELKYQDHHFDKSIYVVGNEQDYHFDVLFKILKKLGKTYANGLYHLSYGMVDLPSGKMKSREGTVVDADDLVQEMLQTAEHHTKELGKIEGFSQEQARELYHTLGLGALKYYLLKVDPKKRMLFNPEESIQFQGSTGPFIQYTYARISAILRKANELDIPYQNQFPKHLNDILPVEKEVIFILGNYEDQVKEAGQSYSPSIIAQYVYDLAKEYNRFYAEAPIFSEAHQDLLLFRVKLSHQVGKTIKLGMQLLGINVPERM
ncbi:MAG: arginine--tRNA ligase [Candidatus Cyclobacteriaceae bacterium M3_2C_046]